MRHALLVLMLLIPATSLAVCTNEMWRQDWSWTYDGSIDTYRVRFELMQTEGAVTGYYFYTSQLKDIRLTGTIADGKRIQLEELNSDGMPEAEINAEFEDKDPQGKLSGTLTCDIMSGTWQKRDGSKSLPLLLRMVGGLPDPHGHRYEVAGAKDDEAINRVAQRFQKAVVGGDKDTAASMIRYPITVYIGKKAVKIDNRQQMTARYDAVFTPGYRKAIETSIPRDMFARYDGIMLGEHGEVWFDEKGRVVTLNNLLTK